MIFRAIVNKLQLSKFCLRVQKYEDKFVLVHDKKYHILIILKISPLLKFQMLGLD